ncbi:MAG: hypothetical protein AAF550_10040 [Myxococcota bacterium]
MNVVTASILIAASSPAWPLLSGCGNERSTEHSRGTRRAPGRPTSSTPETAFNEQGEPRVQDTSSNLQTLAARTPPRPRPRGAQQSPDTTALKKTADVPAGALGSARDLETEIRAALEKEPIASCIHSETRARQPIDLEFEIHVTSSGTVSRAYVRSNEVSGSPKLGEDALSCMRARALGLTLRRPVPHAPTKIEVSFRLETEARRQLM